MITFDVATVSFSQFQITHKYRRLMYSTHQRRNAASSGWTTKKKWRAGEQVSNMILNLTQIILNPESWILYPTSPWILYPTSPWILHPTSPWIMHTTSPGILHPTSPGILCPTSPVILYSTSTRILYPNSPGITQCTLLLKYMLPYKWRNGENNVKLESTSFSQGKQF